MTTSDGAASENQPPAFLVRHADAGVVRRKVLDVARHKQCGFGRALAQMMASGRRTRWARRIATASRATPRVISIDPEVAQEHIDDVLLLVAMRADEDLDLRDDADESGRMARNLFLAASTPWR